VLVEWGKGLLDGISENWLEIEIARDHTGETEVRELAVTAFGERWSAVSF
jgi:tRNA threonylcarbamoyladenosine biosynthesis protein TsaE